MHADEVTGYAICKLARQCGNFVRLTDLSHLPDDGILADIGREYDPRLKMYDHHQGFFTRPNGMPYASAGMLWERFGMIASDFVTLPDGDRFTESEITEIANRVDESLIQCIDAHDADSAYSLTATCSGGEVRPLSISHIIAMMNSDDPKDHDAQAVVFQKAADLMTDILISAILSAAKFIEAKKKFAKVSEIRGNVIVMSEGLPWREIVHENYPEALFVIGPSGHPGNPYSLLAVPVKPESREIKKPIERPEWFKGSIHQGKWIAGGESIEQLEKLAQFNA